MLNSEILNSFLGTIGISIMIKKPEKQKPEVFSFTAPLSDKVWGLIFVAMLGVTIALFLISFISPHEWCVDTDADGRVRVQRQFSMMNSFWFALSAFMQQSPDVNPRFVSLFKFHKYFTFVLHRG